MLGGGLAGGRHLPCNYTNVSQQISNFYCEAASSEQPRRSAFPMLALPRTTGRRRDVRGRTPPTANALACRARIAKSPLCTPTLASHTSGLSAVLVKESCNLVPVKSHVHATIISDCVGQNRCMLHHAVEFGCPPRAFLNSGIEGDHAPLRAPAQGARPHLHPAHHDDGALGAAQRNGPRPGQATPPRPRDPHANPQEARSARVGDAGTEERAMGSHAMPHAG